MIWSSKRKWEFHWIPSPLWREEESRMNLSSNRGRRIECLWVTPSSSSHYPIAPQDQIYALWQYVTQQAHWIPLQLFEGISSLLDWRISQKRGFFSLSDSLLLFRWSELQFLRWECDGSSFNELPPLGLNWRGGIIKLEHHGNLNFFVNVHSCLNLHIGLVPPDHSSVIMWQRWANYCK